MEERYTAIALETFYRGVRFRSRLEARWAVFFDTLAIRWEYEKEGWDLGGMKYLPDFWLRNPLGCWVEIKPTRPTELEEEKASRLSGLTGHPVFVFHEPISVPPDDPPSAILHYNGWDDGYWFCECTDCGAIGIEFEGRADRLPCKRHGCKPSANGDRGHNYNSPRLLNAYYAAISERFGT